MTIANVRNKLELGLKQIAGLEVYKSPPNSVPKMPCAVLDWDRSAADYMHPGNITLWGFRLVLLIAKNEPEDAYKTLDDYIDKTGTKSVKAAIEGQTVGSWAVVTNCENPGMITYMGSPFYGAEFVIKCMDVS